jgi:serine/threonine-protein kinase
MQRFGPFLLEARLDGGGQFELWRASRADDPYRGEARQCVVLRLAEDAAHRRWPAWADPAVARLLRHPAVVRMLDDGTLDGQRWFSFEHVDGIDLRRLLGDGPLPRNVALAITHALVDALCAASSLKAADGRPFELVHGAIAPRWVLVSRLGDVKLGGFGIGYLKPERRSGYDESIWSPERLLGVPDATAQSDLFQVGLVLHRMLFGVDYVSQAQARIREAVTRRDVARSVLPETEPRLDALLRLLLAERPQDRFATHARAREALAAVTAEGPEVRAWLASRT